MKKQLLLLFAITAMVLSHAQITIVKDINPAGDSSPRNLYSFNGKIYFDANDGSNGFELWTSDGTEAGTFLVKDINPNGTSAPGNWFEYNNTLYFSANSGGGSVLHKTDGTESGTLATGDTGLFGPILVGTEIYAVNSTDTNNLWKFTGEGTAAAVAPAAINALGFNLIELNGKLLIVGTVPGTTVGRELYEYDPSTNNFTLIKDIDDATTNSGAQNFTSTGNKVYFRTGTNALWETDGTNSGTQEISVVTDAGIGGILELFAWDGKVFFEGDTGASNDQLWVYNPSDNTVTNVSNITGGTGTGANNHDPSDFAPLGDFLYYAGEIADDTRQWLFRTNGVNSVRIDDAIFDIDDLVVLNDELYFEGDDGTTGNELYKANQTTLSNGETVLEIVNVYPNPAKDHVMFSQNMVGRSYTIFDASGKQISKGTLTSERLNLNLSNGLYLIKVTSENSIFTKKIIVQ